MTDLDAIRALVEPEPAFNGLPTCDEYYEIIQRLANADKALRDCLAHIDRQAAENKQLWKVLGHKDDSIVDMQAEIDEQQAEIERLRGELSMVDNLLARRPAIDHLPDRLDKISHALVTAGKHEPGNKPVRSKVTGAKINKVVGHE